VSGASTAGDQWRGKTLWARDRSAPLRDFLRTESGSAGVLVAAVVAALVWANVDLGSYESFWQTQLSIRLGDRGLSWDLRTWVNSGLMALFFLVVGLEARREFDLGDLRERRRFVLPCLAGLVGMALPVLIYLASPGAQQSSEGLPIDPVCHMAVDPERSAGMIVHEGVRYDFCSLQCVRRFASEPEQFVQPGSGDGADRHNRGAL